MEIDIASLSPEELIDLSYRIKVEQSKKRFADSGIVQMRLQVAKDWDWNKQNFELANEHGVSAGTITRYRQMLGHGKKTKYWPECKSWDWTKSNRELSAQLGIEVGVIILWRRKLGKGQAPREHAFLKDEIFVHKDYSGWDWKKVDIELAKDHNISRERVRQIRAKLGLPKRLVGVARYDQFCEIFKDKTELQYLESRKVLPFPLSRATFNEYCAAAGKKILKKMKVYPWDIVNFQLPDSILKGIWRGKPNVFESHRSQNGIGGAAFRANKHGTIPDSFKPIIEAEKVKAAEWFEKRTTINCVDTNGCQSNAE